MSYARFERRMRNTFVHIVQACPCVADYAFGQKLMITKFRERWEKLKESAKRKKEAKVAAEVATAGVRDRIVEEPEAEEELDGATEP